MQDRDKEDVGDGGEEGGGEVDPVHVEVLVAVAREDGADHARKGGRRGHPAHHETLRGAHH